MLRLIALTLVIMTLSAIAVFADAGFVSSVESYTAEPVAKKKGETPAEDIVAEIVDKDGKTVEIERKALEIVNASDKETPENKETLKKIDDVVKEIEKAGKVTGLLDSAAKKELKDAGIDADKLAVATVFDASVNQTIPEGAVLLLSFKLPAAASIKKSDTYTGKFTLLQENTETGKYEALKLTTNKELKAGEFSVEGDTVNAGVSHTCVFLFAAETVEGGSSSSSLTWLWILLIVIAVLVVVCVIFFVLKKKKK